jgi:hypothetical protein
MTDIKYSNNSTGKYNFSEEFDLPQLIRNLNLSIEQRLIEHQSALDLFYQLQIAGESINEKLKSTSRNIDTE